MSYQKFTKDIGIIGLTNIAIALRGLILLPIITKLLGADNYGIWAQIIVIPPLATLVITLGLPYALVRFLAAEKNKKEIQEGVYSVFLVIFLLVLATSLILFFSSSYLSTFLKWQQSLIRILAFIILFECLNLVFLHIFRVFQQINLYSFFIIFQSLGEIGLTIIAILLGYGLFGAILSLLIIRIINFLITGLIVVRQIGLKFPSFLKIKEYLHFGLPTTPGNISNWFVGFNDRYIIGYFLGLSFVAYYVPAYTLGGIIAFLGAPFSFLLPAVLSKLYDEKKIDDVKRYLKYSLKYLLAIAIPSFFGLSVLARKLLIVLSTPQIAENGYLLVPFMTFSMILYSTYGIIALILTLVKKTSILANIWLIAAFLNLGLNFLLIPIFGNIAAAFNSLITYLFIFVTSCYYSFKYFHFEIDWLFLQKSLLASILMSLFVVFLKPTGILSILIAITSGVFVYGLLIILLRGFNKKEVVFFASLFTNPRF